MLDDPVTTSNQEILPSDPALRQHLLPNGLRVCTVRHPHPKGQLVLQLKIQVGSLHEEQEERGAAHFIEHLAFQGSVELAHGELEKLVASFGTKLGRDHNALTTFEQTAYWMSFPSGGERALEAGLFSLSQIAQSLLLEPEQVARERLVILEEMRGLEGPAKELRSAAQELLAPGSRLVTRPVIGVRQSLLELDSDRLRHFYRRWYRPDNAQLLLIGDLDHDRSLALAAERMGTWQSPPRDLPLSPEVLIVSSRKAKARVVIHPEIENSGVRFIALTTVARLKTRGDLLATLTEEMMLRCLNRRLRWARRHFERGLQGLQASLVGLTRDLRMVQITASATHSDKIPAITEFLAREIRRVEQHGFSERELFFARRMVARSAEERARREEKASATHLARRFQDLSITSHAPSTAEQQWAITQALLPAISSLDIARRFCELFIAPPKTLLVSVANALSSSKQDLVETASKWEARAIAEPDAEFEVPSLSTSITGLPLASALIHPHLQVHSYRASNGIRLHCRSMLEVPGRTFLEASFFGGRIEEREHDVGLTFAAAAAFSDPALEELSPFEVRDFVEWFDLRISHRVEEDRIRLALACSSSDLERGMALLQAMILGIRLTEEAHQAWRSHSLDMARKRSQSPETRLAQISTRLLTGGDPRFELLEPHQIESLDLNRARRWLRALLQDRPLEIAVTGDIEPCQVTDLAQKYLAGLPQRSSALEGGEGLRELPIPAVGPLAQEVEIDQETSLAAVFCGWRAPPWSDTISRRCLFVAADILESRLHEEIRNRLGLTYAVQCAFSPSRAYPSASMLSQAFITQPGRAREGLEAARSIGHHLAQQGPSETEVQTAGERLAKRSEQTQENPVYWARVLSESAFRHLNLDELSRVPTFYRELEVERVRDVIRETMQADNRLEVILEPSLTQTRS